MPILERRGFRPDVMRHIKPMQLRQSGVPLVMVKDFLGHVDMKSTEVYVQADLEMKRKALDSANGPQPTQAPTPFCHRASSGVSKLRSRCSDVRAGGFVQNCRDADP